MATLSPRLGLKKPDANDLVTTEAVGPHDIRDTFDILDDAAMFGQSVHSLRPSASLAGRIWLSTDTGQIALDTGAAWVEMARTQVASTPTGVMMWTAAEAPPDGTLIAGGWLVANGQAVSRSTYATLYAALGGGGSPYGQGNGSTTFNLPDLRGRAPIGSGQGTGLSNRVRGAKVGGEAVLLTGRQSGIQQHSHPFSGGLTMVARNFSSFSNYEWATTPGEGRLTTGGTSTAPTGHNNALDAHENMPPSLVLTPIIKT